MSKEKEIMSLETHVYALLLLCYPDKTLAPKGRYRLDPSFYILFCRLTVRSFRATTGSDDACDSHPVWTASGIVVCTDTGYVFGDIAWCS